MLHGSSYLAYFSDALLRAAWVDGDLAQFARESKWWHRADPGMGMIHSVVEIRCINDALELVLPTDDAETITRALDAIGHLGKVVDSRLPIEQTEVDGAFIDCMDRVQTCVQVARPLHEAEL